MREIRLSGSEGGGAEANRPSLPLSIPDHQRQDLMTKYQRIKEEEKNVPSNH